jgi:uncharacterized membrane protein YozB (DUF420 family)
MALPEADGSVAADRRHESEPPDGSGRSIVWKRFAPLFAVYTVAILGLAAATPLGSRPMLHASLNGSSAALMLSGFLFVHKRRIPPHFVCMTLAAVTSAVFLGSYLYYHAHAGATAFAGQGWIRPVYFAILLSHTLLAAAVPPLVVVVLYLAVRGRFERHGKVARWALPLWIYVSATGVLIYLMLYVWYSSVEPVALP